MSSTTLAEEPATPVPSSIKTYDTGPVIDETDSEERGRLKRRRKSSVSPRRASSPSRGHDRTSGSRYREHHRKHHRASSPVSSVSPPTIAQKKTRRRSDAEPDHTFRGRMRNRSGSRGRTESSATEDEAVKLGTLRAPRRRRSQPPSRHAIEEEDEGVELRRQRSYHNMFKEGRRDSKGDEQTLSGVKVLQDGVQRTEQIV